MTSATMTTQHGTADNAQEPVGTSPFVVEFFMVQGLGVRCMAYCDPQGQWRNAFSHDELFGDIYILE